MRSTARSGDLFGRASELATLPLFLDAVTQGPAALVLQGDAGIGKSALWAAGVGLAEERGYRVLSSRPAEAETSLPFAALGDLLDAVPQDAIETLPEPQRRAVDVAMLRADSHGPAIERRAVSLAVLGMLRGLADDAPVIFAVDDVQWLDPPSATALGFALRRLETERVGLLATRRGRGSDSLSGLERGLSPDQVQQLEIGPLDRESLGLLLVDRLDRPLARAALLQLHRVSAGNPFLALEIARALERREVELARGEPFPVPQNLRELVRDRLDQLAPAAYETALIVAALPHPTVERVEAAALDKGADADALGEALAAGIVELEGERVRFTHPLLASIVYSEASPARRRALHAHLAALALEVEERAGHLAVATVSPDEEVASVLDAAASSALQRGAPEAAAEFSEQALGLTPPDDLAARHRRALAAADQRFEAGDTPAARSLFATVLDLSARGPERAHALTRLASIQGWEHDMGSAIASLEAARLEATGHPALLATIEEEYGAQIHLQGDEAGAAAHVRRALELAESAGDKRRAATALAWLALCEARLGNATAFAHLERAFELQEWLEDVHVVCRPAYILGLLRLGDGNLDGAREAWLSEYRRTLDRGDESSLPVVLEHLSVVERRAGHWDLAERYARESYDIAVRDGLQPVYHSTAWALILALRGDVEAARRIAAEGVTLADEAGLGPTYGGHRAVLGFIELSLGDPAAAVGHLEPLSAPLTSDVTESGWFRSLADEVEARVALGELDRAAALVERLEERRIVLIDHTWARAAAERCRGLLLAARGDEAGAFEAFALALAEHDGLPEPFELGRTLLAQGRAQRRFKQRRAARESLTRARTIFSGLGAPLWVARTQEELHRIGGRAPRGEGLSTTEERVAALAADGLTNREIAAALYLSVNTVQAYLKRIYRELGVRSRTELARQIRNLG
jgi:DNA-binding CsgD family transcriptional regulator